MTGFPGFPEDAIAFLRDLKANNEKPWFEANKPRYEELVKAPAKHFAAHMEGELARLSDRAMGSKIFRIHRDVRFSKDKTPYKPFVHILWRPLEPHPDGPAFYFGLEVDRAIVGAGVFGFDKDRLDAYRHRVAGPQGAALPAMIAKLEKKGVSFRDPPLKRVPRGFDADHPRAELLKRKGLAGFYRLGEPFLACEPSIAKDCVKALKPFLPLYEWLSDAA